MNIYHYSPVNGEYLGASVARESPLEPGTFLIPANTATIPPPAHDVGHVAVYSAGAWSVVPDHRGQRWYKPDGTQVDISEINVVPDKTWTHEPPPPTPQQLHDELVKQAQAALARTDSVALRCIKAGVAFPATWQTYTTELRNIVNGTDTTSISLPAVPAYPAGT